MASSSSFDIVSDFDHQELVNAIDQAKREITTRYDLKGSKTTLELDKETLKIETDSEFTLQTIHDVVQTKAVRRKLSLKIFDYGSIDSISGNRVRQVITLKRGLETELAKKITKIIRDEFKKIQSSIQGDSVRVTAKSKDDLQSVMQRIREDDWPVALQFNNYR